MRSTDFTDIVSPRGVQRRKRGGALARYAEGGAVSGGDYDPNAAIAALNRSLDALTAPSSVFGRPDMGALAWSAGMLAPTRSGSTLESLGNAQRGLLAQAAGDEDRALQVARMRAEGPLKAYQTAGAALDIKEKKALYDALDEMARADTGGTGALGMTPRGKPMAMPVGPGAGSGAGSEGLYTASPEVRDARDRYGNITQGAEPGLYRPSSPDVRDAMDRYRTVDPSAPPGGPGSTFTAPPDEPGAELRRPLEAPPPVAAPRQPVATAPLPAAPRGAVTPSGMTIPSVEGAQPVPAYLANQYMTLFNRLTRATQNPRLAEYAAKYDTMLKNLPIPRGFTFLPDGSGLVPIGDKDPGYILRAKAAGELMVPDGKGGFTFAPNVVAAQAQRAGQIKGAEEWAGVGPARQKEKDKADIASQHDLKEVEAPDGAKVMVPASEILAAQRRLAAGGDGTITGVPTGPSGVGKERFKLDAEQQAAVLGSTRQEAAAATEEIKALAEMRGTIDRGLNTGAAAPYRLAVSKWLSEMGLSDKEIKNRFTGISLNDATRFDQVAKELTLEAMKSKILGSQPTNSDRDFYNKTLPQITDTREAIKAAMDYMEKRAARRVEKWNEMYAFTRPTAQFPNGRDPLQFEIEWNKRHGITAPVGRQQPGAGQQAAPQFTPEQIQAEIARRGLKVQ